MEQNYRYLKRDIIYFSTAIRDGPGSPPECRSYHGVIGLGDNPDHLSSQMMTSH
jgi:hypothetical protein